MQTSQANSRHPQGMRRRDVLKAGLAAGVTLSAWPLAGPRRALGGGSRATQAWGAPARLGL
jgi:hypothetical protein